MTKNNWEFQLLREFYHPLDSLVIFNKPVAATERAKQLSVLIWVSLCIYIKEIYVCTSSNYFSSKRAINNCSFYKPITNFARKDWFQIIRSACVHNFKLKFLHVIVKLHYTVDPQRVSLHVRKVCYWVHRFHVPWKEKTLYGLKNISEDIQLSVCNFF